MTGNTAKNDVEDKNIRLSHNHLG